MTAEQAELIIELLTEMRDELFRQGHSHSTNHYGQPVIYTQEISS